MFMISPDLLTKQPWARRHAEDRTPMLGIAPRCAAVKRPRWEGFSLVGTPDIGILALNVP